MKTKSSSARFVREVAEGRNPFHTLEAARENIGSASYSLSQGKMDRVKYHLDGVDRYLEEMFQYFAALLPDVYHASDGDEAATGRMRQELAKLAARHEREWAAITFANLRSGEERDD